jgi:outer membrane protein OmpA-like peptidoglycan-associated protein
LPPPEKPAFQKQLPPPERPAFQRPLPPPDKPAFQKPLPPPEKPAFQKPLPQPDKPAFEKPLPPPERPAQQFQLPPGAKPPQPLAKPPSTGPATVTPGTQPGPLAPRRFEDVKKFRTERVEGDRKVIQEPGNRFIVKQDNRAIIRHDEAERFLRRPGAQSQRRPDGNVETFYVRSDGVRIVTVVDGNGRLLRRFRRDREGREYNIIDNRRFYRNVAIGVGIGALGIIALNLRPPRVTIPYERYIVDPDSASDDDLYEALDAPPIEPLERGYSLDEIRDNYELRARVRSIDLDTINFDFGSWEIPPDQSYKLERIARAMLRVLSRNPEAVFMVAGFTDAVGSEEDNLSLSDRRAAAVAEVLSDTFGVPPENLVTQGYGEQHLKIDTQGPEPRNRRVAFLNLTGLMAER